MKRFLVCLATVALFAVSASAAVIPQTVFLDVSRDTAPNSLNFSLDDSGAGVDFFQVAIAGASVGNLSLGSAFNSAHWSVETNTFNGYAIFQAAWDNVGSRPTSGEMIHVSTCGWEPTTGYYSSPPYLPFTTMHGGNGTDTWDVSDTPDIQIGIGGDCPTKVSIAAKPSDWAGLKRLYR